MTAMCWRLRFTAGRLIVTFNLSDFPASILGQFHIEAIHPDEFVSRLWDEHPDSVLEAVRLQRAGLKKSSEDRGRISVDARTVSALETAGRLRPFAAQF